ncbi:MAG: transcriptional repressor NrdR [Verrucomicrobia bacterium]|nr:transcriptional repressor NrdR [Verrucomicrobiota bacterium]
MLCPKCRHVDDKVIDSRMSRDGAVIRRRRECLGCGHRFTTYEETERATLLVVKRDGRREDFDRRKLAAGLLKACEKRPVSVEKIDRTVEEIVEDLGNKYDREVPATAIGEAVMKHLSELDEVAYVRFASVYRQFRDINEFVHTIQELSNKS